MLRFSCLDSFWFDNSSSSSWSSTNVLRTVIFRLGTENWESESPWWTPGKKWGVASSWRFWGFQQCRNKTKNGNSAGQARESKKWTIHFQSAQNNTYKYKASMVYIDNFRGAKDCKSSEALRLWRASAKKHMVLRCKWNNLKLCFGGIPNSRNVLLYKSFWSVLRSQALETPQLGFRELSGRNSWSAPKPPRPSPEPCPEPSPEPCWTWPGSAPKPPEFLNMFNCKSSSLQSRAHFCNTFSRSRSRIA